MRVDSIQPSSRADRAGVRPGDELISIGGSLIRDGIDVAYVLGSLDSSESEWGFARDGEPFTVVLPAERPESVGIETVPEVQRTCPNSCVFCFVDQLPPGLRGSLYIKDEDYRLSFVFGNYITLTNLKDDDYARVAEQRLSPLYVSVHATDDAVRRAMLGSPAAPPVMDGLRRLAGSGIDLHTQIVVCPGLNDGDVLESTLADLLSLGGAIRSIAVVPVGLTAHRDGLPAIRPVTHDDARAVLDTVERWQEHFREECGRPVVHAADEIYLLAGRDLPPCEAYEEFPQLENGVGLLRSLETDFSERVDELAGEAGLPSRVTVVTGTLAAPFLKRLIVPGLARVGVEARIIAAENSLFGPSVTVAGLLSGSDLARTIGGAPEADLILIPREALNDDGVTVDDMTVDDIADECRREGIVATSDVIGAIFDFTEEHGRRSEP